MSDTPTVFKYSFKQYPVFNFDMIHGNLDLQYLFFLYLSLVYMRLPLWIYGTTSRPAFSRQLRRCVAQQGPIIGLMQPGGGMSMWERSLQRSSKLSRHGKGTGASSMQPNALPEVQCTMLAKRPTRRSTRILNKSSEVYSLANQF